jgi:hypothetical protein
MNYGHHFLANVKVSLKCLALAVFHLAHAVLPIRLTEHERWIGFKQTVNEVDND